MDAGGAWLCDGGQLAQKGVQYRFFAVHVRHGPREHARQRWHSVHSSIHHFV